MSTTAIALAADYDKLQKLVEAGEFTPEEIADTLEGIEGALGDKLDAIMIHVRNLDGQANTLGEEAKRLAERQAKDLKKYALVCLLASGQDTLKTVKNTFTAAKGRASIVIDDETKIPDSFVDVQTIVSPDKKAIKEALENGIEVPGTRIEIGERSLMVR